MVDQAPVLVLGASGGFGGAVAQALLRHGRVVRALSRNPGRAARRFVSGEPIDIVAGDAQQKADLLKAAEGCVAIVHGINYPYHQWVPFMHTATLNVIEAARQHGALIVFPGNVYGLGAQTGHPLDEGVPNQPTTKKGHLRVRLEETLQAATEASGAEAVTPVRVLNLRAGDYFGPTVRNGMVDRIFGNAAKGKAIAVFGRLDVPHEWVYLPDLAEAAVALLDRADTRAPYDVVHVAGHVLPTQRAFVTQVAERAGHPGLSVRTMPWPLVRLFGLFDGPARELIELRYLFESAVTLDGAKLRRLLPGLATTPLENAIDQTLESYRA